jgi:hypothetical protein
MVATSDSIGAAQMRRGKIDDLQVSALTVQKSFVFHEVGCVAGIGDVL